LVSLASFPNLWKRVFESWCLVQIYQTFGKGFDIGTWYSFFCMCGGWRENKTSKSYNPILIYFKKVVFYLLQPPQKKEEVPTK